MRRFWRCGVLLVAAWGGMAAAQKLTVVKPEAIAGRWETGDGHGGMVGMSITLVTHVMGRPTTLMGATQYLDEFEIGVYRRTGAELEPPGYNFFVADARGGATWDGEHLAIRLDDARIGPRINVLLTWKGKSSSWAGTFERGEFKGQVILRPPANVRRNRLVGTWLNSRGRLECVHIAQQEDGAFTGWSDEIQLPGRMRFRKCLKPPDEALEQYGDIAQVESTAPGRVLVTLHALTPMCCPHAFAAKISGDGKTLAGSWVSGPNGAALPLEWIKIPQDSCGAAASEEGGWLGMVGKCGERETQIPSGEGNKKSK